MSRELSLEVDGKALKIVLGEARTGRFSFQMNGRSFDAEVLAMDAGKVSLRLNGRAWEVETRPAQGDRGAWEVVVGGRSRRLKAGAAAALRPSEVAPAPKRPADTAPASRVEGAIEAPMPGKILKVHVEAGQKVKKGDLILTLEAMKMENRITAHVDGVIESVRARQGMNVVRGECMVVMKRD